MVKIFELNNHYYEEMVVDRPIIKAADIFASKNPSKDAEALVKSVIVIFIRLASRIWRSISGDDDSTLMEGIVQDIRFFFETLREAIDVEPTMPLFNSDDISTKFRPIPGCYEERSKPRFITPTIMYEFSSIAIMLIAKCQQDQRSIPSMNRTQLTKTIALNLLHYATTRCHRMIVSRVQYIRMARIESSHAVEPPPGSSLRDIAGNSSLGSQRSCDNIHSSSEFSRRNQSRLRKKKAASNYSDEKNRFSSTNDSDMSELEETALSTIDALDISSEMSEDDDYQDLINLDSSSGEDNLCQLSRPAIRASRSHNYEMGQSKKFLDNRQDFPNALDLVTGDLEFHRDRPRNDIVVPPLREQIPNLRKRPVSDQMSHRLDSALEYLYLHTYLPTIKILFDWLLSNVDVIDSNLESFINFNNELANITQLLNEIIKLSTTREASMDIRKLQTDVSTPVYSHRFDNPDWVQKFPLSCDFPLCHIGPLKNVHDINIDFNCSHELNDAESGYLTAQCVLAFSHALESFLNNKTI